MDTMIAISFEVVICSWWTSLFHLNKPSLETWLDLADILKGQQADMNKSETSLSETFMKEVLSYHVNAYAL